MFDPRTKELYTNSGKLIKKLHCPFTVNWNELGNTAESNCSRICTKCTTPILDTANYKDRELWKILVAAPDTCLKVDLNQANISIIHPKYSFDDGTML